MSASNRFFFVGATILLISLGASAAEVTVPGGSIDQIAEAVAEAGPGGRVTLGAGNHVITKTVVVDVNGVTIRGASGSKILGRGNVAGERLVLFEIRANDVTMKDLDVAAAVQSVGDLALVVVFSGQRLSVTDCEAVDLVQLVDGRDAASLMALRNRVTTAIPTEADPPASHLVVIRTSGIGEVLIEANRLTGPRTADTVGIGILPPEGAVHHVVKNDVVGYDTGIAGEGEGQGIVVKNSVERCTNGIVVGQEITAILWEIDRNFVDDMLSTGIFLGDGDNTMIRKNKVRRCTKDGLNLGGVFLSVTRNRTRLNAGTGLFGATNSCDYLRNRGKRSGRGIRVEGAGNRLTRNRAVKNTGDGVVSVGGNVNGNGNRGSKNGGVQVSIQ